MKPFRYLAPIISLLSYSETLAFPGLSHLLAPRFTNDNPADFGNIKTFAALGDSYAAGIGSGVVLTGDGDAKCSRYDGAYPVILNNAAFGGEPTFTFSACSGDLSKNVQEQVTHLAWSSQDVISLSAGGNDAFLSDVLSACVFLASTQGKCDEALAKTKAVIDKELQSNIDDLLSKVGAKLSKDGIIVYTLYAQFFNADTDACSFQTWNFVSSVPGITGVFLTKELRKKLNDLVVEANKKIQAAITARTSDPKQPLNIVVVDWDKTVGDRKGRFCEEGEHMSVAKICTRASH